MAKVTGAVGQNKSKYKFYIEYSTSFNNSTMKWTVKCTAYLEVDHWTYEGNTRHPLYIGGNKVDSRYDYNKSCSSNNGVRSFKIASGTKTYAASTSARSVKMTANLNAPSGGYGPGVCKVSKTISLPAKLSSAGSISFSNVTSHSCTVKASGLATGLGYTRTVKFYYKLSSSSAWTLIGSNSVASGSSSVSRLRGALLPGRTYNFKYEVYAPNGTLMKTCSSSVTTATDPFTLSLSAKTGTSVSVRINGLDSNVGYARTLHGYYKKKTDTVWTKAPTVLTIASTASASVAYTFTGLASGIAYDFYIACLYSSTELSRATFATTTNVVVPETPYEFSVTHTETGINLEITDNISPYFDGQVAVYVCGDDTIYHYLGMYDVTCGASAVTISIPFPSDDVLSAIVSKAYTMKLFILDLTTNKVEALAKLSVDPASEAGSYDPINRYD